MASFLGIAILALLGTWFIRWGYRWYNNVQYAKASGFSYTLIPANFFGILFPVLNFTLVPLLRRLPRHMHPRWVELWHPEHIWSLLYYPFGVSKNDTYLTVTPEGSTLWTANPELITQIAMRRNDFPKPVWIYGSIDTYGRNVVTAEGSYWRELRRIVSPPFAEKNNQLVWKESIVQAILMQRTWTELPEVSQHEVRSTARDTMRLSLHIISRAGFGVRLLWPELQSNDDVSAVEDRETVRVIDKNPGHELSFEGAIETVLHNILLLLILPHSILSWVPLQKVQKALRAYDEWGRYMRELMVNKQAELQTNQNSTGLDLMGALVGGGTSEKSSAGNDSNRKGNGNNNKQKLEDDEIIGNAWVFLLAGHETTANTLHWAINFLARYPHYQKQLQAELDDIFGDRPLSAWDYDRDLPRLFGGMTGAILNEILRLIPPVISIPKCTHERPMTVTIDGTKFTVPPNSYVNMCAAAVGRNPKYWPHGPPSDPAKPAHPLSNRDNDLEEFKPDRWFIKAADSSTTSSTKASTFAAPSSTKSDTLPEMASNGAATAETDDLGINTAADTSSSLFRPLRGSYIPFSEGYRSCLGRRFAQVEVIAVIAVLFHSYSVELSVDRYLSEAEKEQIANLDQTKTHTSSNGDSAFRGPTSENGYTSVLRGLSPTRRHDLWKQAHDEARRTMREDMGSRLTLQLRGGACVPVRWMPRGKEVFEAGRSQKAY